DALSDGVAFQTPLAKPDSPADMLLGVLGDQMVVRADLRYERVDLAALIPQHLAEGECFLGFCCFRNFSHLGSLPFHPSSSLANCRSISSMAAASSLSIPSLPPD